MKPEIAKLLLEALPDWEQYTGSLGLPGTAKRCCLGVLQELAPPHLEKEDLEENFPSLAVQQWAGLDPTAHFPNPDGPLNDVHIYIDETSYLAKLNDNVGWNAPLGVISYLSKVARGEDIDIGQEILYNEHSTSGDTP